jgi:hypothetical protein
MSNTTNIYGKLDHAKREIRVAHILPGTWTDPISCELHVVSLDDSPQYEALSYVWGNAAITAPITVNSCELQVTTNLSAALRRLRKDRETRVIWIDAICINQKSVQERNEQVSLMGEIYEETKEVIIWLGDHVEATCSNPEMVERGRGLISTLIDGLLDPYTDLRLKDNAIFAGFSAVLLMSKLWHEEGPEILTYDEDSGPRLHPQWPHGMVGLTELTQFPWWNRIWTAQESILPPSATMIYGSLEVSLDTLTEAIIQVGQKCGPHFSTAKPDSVAYVLWDPYQKIFAIRGIKIQRKSGGLSPLVLFLMCTQRRATDPRDKIFGLLGLLRNQIGLPSIKPDYELEKEDIYRMATLEFLKFNPAMEMFEFDLINRPGMASWVLDWDPQWSTTESFYPVLRVGLAQKMQCSPHDSRSPEEYFQEVEKGLLHVETFSIDKISAIPQCTSSEALALLPTSEQLLEIAGMERNIDQTYKTGGTWEDAYWQTLLGQYEDKIDVSNPKDIYFRWKTAWYGPETEDNLALRNDVNVYDFQHAVEMTLSGRQLFVSTQGYLGVGPSGMQHGDEIHIFSGARVPYVVRRSTPPYKDTVSKESEVLQGRYRLLGCCYIHGIMDGELFKGEDKIDFKPLILE